MALPVDSALEHQSLGELVRSLLHPRDRAFAASEEIALADLARPGLSGAAAIGNLHPASRRRLEAAFELGRRRARAAVSRRRPVGDAADAVRILRPLIVDAPVEVFRALLLDVSHRVLAVPEISRGTLSTSLVHPREVFRPAIAAGAAAVLVGHNHPSGDPAPSPEDHAVTRRLVAAGVLLGIPVLDHLVIGDTGHYSYREAGHDAFAAVDCGTVRP